MSGTQSHLEIRRKRSEKTEGIRKRILEESVKLFLEQGYEKTTTRQILQRVGILNGSLYNIYRSKEEIFSDIIMIALAEVAHQAPETDPDYEWSDRLSYVLCMELYISERSPRIAELLSLISQKRAIRDRISDTVMTWHETSEFKDADHPLMILDALTGVTSAFIHRMVSDPEKVDSRKAMEIVVRLVDSLLEHERRDVSAVVDRMERHMSEQSVSICGIPII